MGRKEIFDDELCSTCAYRFTCDDRDDDMVIDLCSIYEQDLEAVQAEDEVR